MVRLTQSVQVATASNDRIAESHAPCEVRASECTAQACRRCPREAAVPVHEGMDRDESMMETSSGGDGVVRPGTCVKNEVVNHRCDESRLDTEVGQRSAIATRPAPDVTEHPLMELSQPEVIQDGLGRRVPDPTKGPSDVLLLGTVEIRPSADPCLAKPDPLVRVQDRLAVIRFFGPVPSAHFADQRPRRSMRSSAARSSSAARLYSSVCWPSIAIV